MIGLDQSTSAKLAVQWIIINCYYVVDLIQFELLFFIVNFLRLKLSFLNILHFLLFTYFLHIFDFFYLKINKPNIHNNIIDTSSFQNGLNILFSSTGFYFKSKVLEGSHKGKKLFFNFWALLVKMYIFAVLVFFSCLVVIQWRQFFSGSTHS